jgi:hypothetical protein
VSSVGLGSGVGKHRVIAWGNQSQGFGVHASAASVGDLGIASAEMPHLGLAVTLAQSVVLPVANATQGHLAENIYNLGVANATLGHTVAAPTQTQLHILVAVSDEQGHEATPVLLVKNLVGMAAEMPHEATPDTLVKNVLMANAILGHEGTALQMTLTVNNATMGHNGLAVGFGGAAANLTVVAGTMPHDGLGVEGFSPSQLPDLRFWYAPESGVTVSGSRVLQWNDKSPSLAHLVQVSVSSAPTHVSAALNGYNTVRFTANNSSLLGASARAPTSAIFSSSKSSFVGSIVVGPTTGLGVAATLFRVNCPGTFNDRMISTTAAQSTYHFSEVVVGGGAFSAANVVSAFVTAAHILRWSWVCGAVAAWVNGSQVLATAKVCAGGDANLGVSAEVHIGSFGAFQYLGDITEIIVGSTAWSSAQGRELDKLLGAKYGITIT